MTRAKQSEIDEATRGMLLARARAAAANAYAPYSGFPVGAALLAADGQIYARCNDENASIGLTVCAERSAVSAAVAAGQREILAVAVSAPKAAGTTPCGACRQVLNEFRPDAAELVVILDDRQGGESVRFTDLLPRGFGPKNLEQVPD